MLASVRAKGATFGFHRGFQDRTEALDGRDLVEWLASRPWSTGKVGMLGCSCLGGATTAAPMDQPMMSVGFITVYLISSVDRMDANALTCLEEIDATAGIGADPRQRNIAEIRESPAPAIHIHFGGDTPSKIESRLISAETVFRNG